MAPKRPPNAPPERTHQAAKGLPGVPFAASTGAVSGVMDPLVQASQRSGLGPRSFPKPLKGIASTSRMIPLPALRSPLR
jgi:hypothetical protein